jgi:hypothetical protein
VGGEVLSEFAIKDSGKRESFDSGMVRDTEDGKLDYSLVLDGPMFKRWAAHLTKGAAKYAPRNWMKAAGQDEYDRFKRSFLRHMVAYLDGQRDEDHAAAMVFNINGMEYVREQLEEGPDVHDDPSWGPESAARFGQQAEPKHVPEFSGGITREPPAAKLKCIAPGYQTAPPCGVCATRGRCGLDFRT